MVASLLSRHAPKLETLWVTGDGFAEDVTVAWEASHENRTPQMRRSLVYPRAPLGPHGLH